jgi:hypothetical protein
MGVLLRAMVVGGVLIASAAGAQARRAPTPAATPRARMREFQRAMENPSDALVRFFPRQGEWVLEHREGAAGRLSLWRHTSAQIAPAADCAAPWRTFLVYPNGISGAASTGDRPPRGDWQRVRPNRFVPPGRGAASPLFVEWRLEGGTWVVSSIGDATPHDPQVSGALVQQRTTPPPAPPLYADRFPWYVDGAGVGLWSREYTKYGLPRAIDPSEVVAIGWLGDLPLYADRTAPIMPEIVYFPLASGELQAYHPGGYLHCVDR